MKGWITGADAAKLIGFCAASVVLHGKRGHLGERRKVGRNMMYTRTAVMRFARAWLIVGRPDKRRAR